MEKLEQDFSRSKEGKENEDCKLTVIDILKVLLACGGVEFELGADRGERQILFPFHRIVLL